ncbi:hypothetical protein BH11GEM1_BH11GEM1_27760 [soil metagenome]
MTVTQEQVPTYQAVIAGRIDGLRRNGMVLELRASDLGVQLNQLEEKSHHVMTREEQDRFSQPIAETQHRLTAATLEVGLNRRKLEGLEKEYARMTTVVATQHEPLFGRKQLEETEFGVFLLLLPVVFALTRRMWVRRGTNVDQVSVLESSPRLERIEQALESVAIEVERISEAQRFSARLLAERGTDAGEHRSLSRPISAPRSITPH